MHYFVTVFFFFLMIRRPPRSTLSSSSAASDVYKRQVSTQSTGVDNRQKREVAANGSTTCLGAMRLAIYALVSLAATVAVVANAIVRRGQFYPAVIYLSTSKLSLMVLGNALFTLVVIVGKTAKVIFFGTLREVEIEHMYDKAWSALIEMCIAMTIFREEFSSRFVALATVLSFVKIFHWLTEHRLEYIEQAYLQLPRTAHLRIATLMVLLTALDITCVWYAVNITLEKGPSVLLLFAFEYVVLLAMVVTLFIKYLVHCADMRRQGRWEAKGVYIFYLQLVSDLFQLFVYMIFFLIVCAYYGLPLHIIRDLYVTYTNFKRRINQYLQYRRLSRILDMYPNVEAEELAEGDPVCIICRDEMSTAKRLPCNHCFHVHCLRQWLELHTTCPTCRQSVWQQPPPEPVEDAAGGPPPMLIPPPAQPANANPALAHPFAPQGLPQAFQAAAQAAVQAGGQPPHQVQWTVLQAGRAQQPLPGPGLEQPVLSNETLKLHIEWQIESLQALLQQVNRSMAEQAAEEQPENAAEIPPEAPAEEAETSAEDAAETPAEDAAETPAEDDNDAAEDAVEDDNDAAEDAALVADIPQNVTGAAAAADGQPVGGGTVSYTHLRAHETVLDLVCRLLLEKKKKT
eukprot:TRINITY_DN1314_c0_g2_i1.p1 TRINITY_DN1314_c0_g2~~TRINITY_DN1314_c0_g2_i1.p1  ORF type:complete len:628 (+),score=150.97 TRINITY_DN1314_c0_g2_i1:37-1920(+)